MKSSPRLWDVSTVCSIFKKAIECSPPHQYQRIRLLSALIKVELNGSNLLSEKQYEFHSSRSTVDKLAKHRIIIKAGRFKSVYAALWVINYFPACNPSFTEEMLLSSRLSSAIFMTDVQTSYILFFPLVQRFTASTRIQGTQMRY